MIYAPLFIWIGAASASVPQSPFREIGFNRMNTPFRTAQSLFWETL